MVKTNACKGLKPSMLKHGLEPDKKFDPVQLRMGVRVEQEHTSCKALAKGISKAHLVEDPRYYTHLKVMEKKYKR